MYTCRECENVINQASELCPYCGADLTVPASGEVEAPEQPRSLAKILLRWGMLLLVLSSALWGFLWFVLPERAGNPAARAETIAIEALRDIRAALASYASAQGGAYPESLELLGDRARLPAQRAQSQGYRVEYSAGRAGSDGAAHNYILLARPGNYGYRGFYLDETGVLRATRENRPATAQDAPI